MLCGLIVWSVWCEQKAQGYILTCHVLSGQRFKTQTHSSHRRQRQPENISIWGAGYFYCLKTESSNISLIINSCKCICLTNQSSNCFSSPLLGFVKLALGFRPHEKIHFKGLTYVWFQERTNVDIKFLWTVQRDWLEVHYSWKAVNNPSAMNMHAELIIC